MAQVSNSSTESPEELMQMLRDLIAKEQATNVVKLSVLCLIKIKDIYPSLA